jgi:rod shape-determining protein MreD
VRHFISGRSLILIGFLLTLGYLGAAFFPVGTGQPDFLYLMVLYYGFFWSWERVPFFAFGIGLLRDFLGGHLFGVETLSLTLAGLLLSVGTQKVERESFWVRIAMSSLFVALAETLRVSLGRGLELSHGLSLDLIQGIIWTTMWTTALAPFFFWFTGRWLKRSPAYTQYELF